MSTEAIVILGWAGSGKTLFVGALAERLSNHSIPEVVLDPQDKGTYQYVQTIIAMLRNGQIPPSTLAGNPAKLHWNLTIPGVPPVPVQVIDSAGQDYKEIFGDAIPDIEQLSPHLQAAAHVCRSATLVVLLLDLRQIVGERDQQIRDQRELAVKFALDYYRHHQVDCCLVLTKWDQVSHLVESDDLNSYLSQHLPLLKSLYLENGNLPIFPISSVNKWKIVVSSDESHGQSVPDSDFQSEGFEPFVEWVSGRLRMRFHQKLIRQGAIGLGVIFFLFMAWTFVLWPLWSWMNTPSTRSPAIPIPVISNNKAEYGNDYIFYPDTIIVRGKVTNQGAKGSVSVIAKVHFGNRSWVETRSADLVENQSWEFEIPVQTDINVKQAGVIYDVDAQ